MSRFIQIIFMILMLPIISNAGFTVQGRLLESDGSPVLGSSVQFRFQVRTSGSENCLIYEETQTLNLQSTRGSFSATIGDGTRSAPSVDGGLALSTIFSNTQSMTTVSSACADASTSYTPSSTAVRMLKISYNDGSGWDEIPTIPLNAVPQAMYAYDAAKLGGVNAALYLLRADVPQCAADEFLTRTVSGFECQGLDFGTGSGQIPQLDGSGQLLMSVMPSSVSSTVASVGSATAQNTVNTLVLRDGSGGVSFTTVNTATVNSTNLQATNNSVNNIYLYNSGNTNYVRLAAPTTLTNHTLTMPQALGASGTVLTTDGSGQLSWSTPATSTQWTTSGTSISYSAGRVGIGTSTPATKFHISDGTSLSSNISSNYSANDFIITANSALNSAMISANSISAGDRAVFGFVRARGSISTPGAVQANDTLGTLLFGGFDGSQINNGGGLFAYADGTPTFGNTPTRLSFVTGNNYSDRQERLTIKYNGYVGVGTSSPASVMQIVANANGSTGLVQANNQSTGNVASAGFRAVNSNPSSATFGITSSGFTPAGNLVPNIGYMSSSSLALQATGGTGYLSIATGGTSEKIRINPSGSVGIGISAPTAKLHLVSGTTSAGTSPLKLTAGTVMSTPEDGAIEYDGTNLFYTDSTNTRRTLASTNSSSSSSFTNVGQIANPSGSITLSPSVGNSVLINQNTSSLGTGSGALVVTGGVGIGENLNVGGDVTTTGIITGASVTATSGMITPYIYGSAAASGSLYLDSTVDATKGNVIISSLGGRVGIGTSSPTSTLTIRGTANASTPLIRYNSLNSAFGDTVMTSFNGDRVGVGYNGSRAVLVLTDAPNGTTSSKDIAIDSGGSERVRITSAGHVGIATSSPTHAMTIASTKAASGIAIYNTSDQTTNYERGVLKWSGNAFLFGTEYGGSATTRTIRIGSAGLPNQDVTSGRTLDFNGSIPFFKVTANTGLAGNVFDFSGIIFSGSTTGQVAFAINPTINQTGTSSYTALLINPTHTSIGSGSQRLIDAQVDGVSKFILTSSGTVGIGTVSPSTALDVAGIGSFGGNSTNGGLKIISSSGGLSTNINSNGIGAWITVGGIYGASLANGNLTLESTSNAVKGYISLAPNGGNVGIGTSSPTSRLQVVSATAGVTVATFSDGTATCSVVPGTGVSCSSDIRLKKDINILSDALSLDKILKLNSVTYKWKNGDEKNHTGYIAQDIEKITPELIVEGDDGFKQVNYTGFIPFITGAIKELNKKIENISSSKQNISRELASLKQQNQILDLKVKKLEKENTELQQIKNYICSKDPKASLCKSN